MSTTTSASPNLDLATEAVVHTKTQTSGHEADVTGAAQAPQLEAEPSSVPASTGPLTASPALTHVSTLAGAPLDTAASADESAQGTHASAASAARPVTPSLATRACAGAYHTVQASDCVPPVAVNPFQATEEGKRVQRQVLEDYRNSLPDEFQIANQSHAAQKGELTVSVQRPRMH